MSLEVILAVGPVGTEGAVEGLLARMNVEMGGKVLPLVSARECLVAHVARQGHVVGYRPQPKYWSIKSLKVPQVMIYSIKRF